MKMNLSSSIVLNKIPEQFYRPRTAVDRSEITRNEKITTEIFAKVDEGVKLIANAIEADIKAAETAGRDCVLGLGTGQSLTPVFEELTRRHEAGLSFANVVVFNAYEYFPLNEGSKNSSLVKLHELFLDKVDVKPENVFSFDGTIAQNMVTEHCRAYEKQIKAHGGIDILVLGIGRRGNVASNEPGSGLTSVARLVLTDDITRNEMNMSFVSQEPVPPCSVTLGMSNILKAKKIFVTAWGDEKADIIQKMVEGNISDDIPATFLQTHADATVVIDLAAAAKLTRIVHPWLVTRCEWNDKLTRSAVVWLCQKTGKPILKLTNKDYNDNGLNELLALYGSGYNVNIKIFNDLQHTITGWPGGKPNADDTYRPERANPFPKRVIAVGDEEVTRFMHFVNGFNQLFIDNSDETIKKMYADIKTFLANKKAGDIDTPEVRTIKGLIRRGEARTACTFNGIPLDHVHFLDLPFYESGKIEKLPMSERDVNIVRDLILDVKPQQIFVAGDLADPHGTHRKCTDAVLAALDLEKEANAAWLKDCRVWMYRGAWAEWEIENIEMCVPMSPEELRAKRNSILKHSSQMESAPFLGNDERLFWQRSEDRNHDTAKLYHDLGLACYEAMEAFVEYVP